MLIIDDIILVIFIVIKPGDSSDVANGLAGDIHHCVSDSDEFDEFHHCFSDSDEFDEFHHCPRSR